MTLTIFVEKHKSKINSLVYPEAEVYLKKQLPICAKSTLGYFFKDIRVDDYQRTLGLTLNKPVSTSFFQHVTF